MARRHAAMFRKSNPRLLLFTSNISLVRFTGTPGTDLTVHHEVLTKQLDINTPQVVEAGLSPPPDPQPVPKIVPANAEATP